MVDLDRTWLNRTPNKTARPSTPFTPRLVVWHETAGYGSLAWNLKPEVKASFNYLIARDGTIYHYVDERQFYAWHAGIGPTRPPYQGKSRWTIGGDLYVGNGINVYAIGVELEGPNDGTPITRAQTSSSTALLRHVRDTYGIPLDAAHHPEHADVAPEYKTDARGYAIAALLAQALQAPPSPTGYSVDTALLPVWDALGGLGRQTTLGWLPGPGYAVGPLRPFPDGNGQMQICERFIVGRDRAGAPRIPLAAEVKAWGLS